MRTLQLRKFNELYSKYGLGSVKNLHLVVQLILIGRTVNLWKLKDYVGMILGNTQVQPMSHYQRLIRFFNKHGSNEAFILDVQKQAFKLLRTLRFTHLLLDGTSWKRGDQKYHYMVLSVLAGSVAIPIYWKQLSKIGSSNQQERLDLFKQAAQHFDLRKMTLLADREYIGKTWFKYLKTNKINFVIRLRFGDYYEWVDHAPGKTYQQMYDKCFLQGKFVRKHFKIDEQSYFISMRPNPKKTRGEEVIIFLTTIRPVLKTIDQYVKRWRIECLFRDLKTNGFSLEELNLKDVGKSNLMMALIGLAHALTVRTAWKTQSTVRRIRFKNRSIFPAQSIFRQGLALITAWCSNFELFIEYVQQLCQGPFHHRIIGNV